MDWWDFILALLLFLYLVLVSGWIGYEGAKILLDRRLLRMSRAPRKADGPSSIDYQMGYLDAISDVLKTNREFRAKEVGDRLSQVGVGPGIQTGPATLTNASTWRIGGP